MKGLYIPQADSRRKRFALQCETIVKEIYPSMLDKVEGLIEGSGLEATDFKTYFYTRSGPPQIGCTNIAILPPYTRDGRLLLGANYDWFYSAIGWREVRVVWPQEGYSSLSVTHHWAGSPQMLNEQGLAVLLAALPEREAQGPGLQWHLVIDILGEKCASVKEACTFITSVPHLRAFSYLIADEREAIVAEATPEGVDIREPEGGFLVVTNHRPGREKPEEELTEWERARQQRSLTRYQRAKGMIQERLKIDMEAAKGILRDHEGGICRGDHSGEKSRGGFHAIFGTIWSFLSQPQRREIFLASGHPCNAEYERFSLLEDGYG